MSVVNSQQVTRAPMRRIPSLAIAADTWSMGSVDAMTRIFLAIVLFLAAVVQATLLPKLVPGIILPNIVLALILVRTARTSVAEGLIWALFAGLILDVLSLDRIGANVLALVPVVLIGAAAKRPIFTSSVLYPMVLAIGATFANALVLGIVRGVTGDWIAPASTLLRLSLLQSLMNAVLVALFWGISSMTAPQPRRGV